MNDLLRTLASRIFLAGKGTFVEQLKPPRIDNVLHAARVILVASGSKSLNWLAGQMRAGVYLPMGKSVHKTLRNIYRLSPLPPTSLGLVSGRSDGLQAGWLGCQASKATPWQARADA